LRPRALGGMRARDPAARRGHDRRMRPGQGARRPGQAHRRQPGLGGHPRSGHAGRSEGSAGMSTQVEMQGQVALVTGASRGIGAAIAQELAARGMKVVGTATTDEGAQKITQGLAQYAGCRGAKLDVNDAAAAEALVDAVAKENGGLHVLVNNAGITRDHLAMRMKDDEWEAVLDTNLKAVFRMSRAVMRTMMKQRYGRIVSITS